VIFFEATCRLAMDEYQVRELMSLAYKEATRSPDPSTQVGALLFDPHHKEIVALDHNHFPEGVRYGPERWERPLKYQMIEHAERNVIFSAARHGYPTIGLTMVCPWAACADCARAVIQSGVTTLVRHAEALERSPERWLEQIAVANSLLREAGVTVIDFSGKIGGIEVLHSGTRWVP